MTEDNNSAESVANVLYLHAGHNWLLVEKLAVIAAKRPDLAPVIEALDEHLYEQAATTTMLGTWFVHYSSNLDQIRNASNAAHICERCKQNQEKPARPKKSISLWERILSAVKAAILDWASTD